MEKILVPIYDHLLLQVTFGALVWANLALFTTIRYEMVLPRFYTDLGALPYYRRSGLWLAALVGFVAATLPDMLMGVASVVLLVMMATWLLVTRVENRIHSDAQA